MEKYKFKVHSIETMATLDGDGIRVAIFFQGCPLRCVCCHNPDTWALDKAAYEMDHLEILNKIMRNRFYFSRGGGVTFTGGEPLLCTGKLISLVEMLKEEHIDTLLDTSGCILNEDVKKLITLIDHIILDFKYPDNQMYTKYAGMTLKQFIDFIDECKRQNKRLVLRTVIIPGINDNFEVMDKYIEIVNRYTIIDKWELLAFHTMGFFKYEKMGIKNPLENYNALDVSVLDKLQKYVDSKTHIKGESSRFVQDDIVAVMDVNQSIDK